LALACQQTEVIAEQEDGVEEIALLERSGDCPDADIGCTTPSRHFDRERRDIDTDHLQAAVLQVEADPACAAPQVEDSPPYEAHRAPLLWPPLPKRS
jgi:hypothetical protein